MPTTSDAFTCHTHQVRGLIRSIAAQIGSWLDIISSSVSSNSLYYALSHVLSILWVVCRLLAVDQCYSIDIVILMVCVFVSAHDEFLFCSLEADGSDWLWTFTRYVHISHVLICHSSRLRWDVILSALLTATNNWIAELTCRSNGWKHRLAKVV